MDQSKIKIAFFGSSSFVTQVLDKLNQEFDVKLVITAGDSPVKDLAKKKGIEFLTPQVLDQTIEEKLKSLEIDLIVVASYGKIIPLSLIKSSKNGAINIHPSLLPKYRGPSPVPTTILNGDEITGVTIIQMDEKMDHGPIIYAKEISLTGQEDRLGLVTKLFHLGTEALNEVIPNFISGKIEPIAQDESKVTFCKKITREDGFFDIDNPTTKEILDRMIRAYYPWPTVWTLWKEKIVKFLPPRNGEKIIQIEGKKQVLFKDFLNGYKDFPLKDF